MARHSRGAPDPDAFRVLLVGNYAPDGQHSMQRFAWMLQQGLTGRGIDVSLVTPPAIVRRAAHPGSGRDKWLGYVDKLLLFPPRLRGLARSRGRLLVHVCDHSNALYVPCIRHLPHLVTCHDLLAIRAALGEFDCQRTQWPGRQLQHAIRTGLRAANCIVCDSTATRSDLERLLARPAGATPVIHPGVSPAFRSMARDDAWPRVRRLCQDAERERSTGAASAVIAPDTRYLLHLGGNQWYKNRTGLIDIYAALVEQRPDAPPLVLAGRSPDAQLRGRITARGLAGRVAILTAADDHDLRALYACAGLFLFPSLAEGFGWPVLEAMACACRVVASGIPAVMEGAAEAATYIDPARPQLAALTVASVLGESPAVRRAHVTAGLTRAARLSPEAMTDRYLALYRDEFERRRARRADRSVLGLAAAQRSASRPHRCASST